MSAAEAEPGLTVASGTRKAQIARTAAELFCERDYHTVGLGEIAAASGITGPAIYRHFRNKQAILSHAAGEFSAILAGCAQRALAANGTGEQRLEHAVREFVVLVVRRRRSVRIYQWEGRHLEPADHARLTAAINELVGVLAGILGQVRPGVSDADRMTLSCAACSAIASLSTHRVSVGAKLAERTLRGVAFAVLASGLPPRLAQSPVEDGVPGAGDEFATRRERLLGAALRPLRERGFHAVSMEEIGTAAGISGSSVYRHFSSKADLLAAVYYRAVDRLTAATSAATEGAREPAAALRGLVDAYVRFSFEHSDLAAVYLSEYENLPDDDRHALRRTQREHVEQWVRLIGAVRSDSSSTHTRLVVHAALNVVHDLAMSQHRRADTEQVKHIVFAVLSY